MRTFAVGDIHGQIDALERLCAQIPIDWQTDELVFVGDLIDRGPSPRRVLEFVRRLQTRSARVQVLRGNHEQALLDCYDSTASFELWLRMGAEATIASYCGATTRLRWPLFASAFPADMHDYLESLPLKYQNRHATFVHAGARRNSAGNWAIDNAETALWYRARDFWCEYQGEPIVVGHTPTNKIRRLFGEDLQPQSEMTAWQRDNIIAIDCGAGQGGQLCAVELPARNFYYQPTKE